jgi:hypothetical protein
MQFIYSSIFVATRKEMTANISFLRKRAKCLAAFGEKQKYKYLFYECYYFIKRRAGAKNK